MNVCFLSAAPSRNLTSINRFGVVSFLLVLQSLEVGGGSPTLLRVDLNQPPPVVVLLQHVHDLIQTKRYLNSAGSTKITITEVGTTEDFPDSHLSRLALGFPSRTHGRLWNCRSPRSTTVWLPFLRLVFSDGFVRFGCQRIRNVIQVAIWKRNTQSGQKEKASTSTKTRTIRSYEQGKRPSSFHQFLALACEQEVFFQTALPNTGRLFWKNGNFLFKISDTFFSETSLQTRNKLSVVPSPCMHHAAKHLSTETDPEWQPDQRALNMQRTPKISYNWS